MRQSSIRLSSSEKTATFSLASIFAFRMLGQFMIIPVFSIFAQNLSGATPFLIGIAMGCYGLTQALLQIPFGMWSDKIGRKIVITIGLIIFALGSVIAGFAHSIWGIILGRSLQGAGAIGSTIMALLADLTSEKNRTKAMATIGITIGMAFAIAMVLGPIVNGILHVQGIFWLTAVLACFGLLILHTWVPTPARLIVQASAEVIPANLPKVLRNPKLLKLDFSIFILHAILTASFIAIPLTLQNMAGLPEKQQWMVYFPVLLLAFISMVPFIILAEKGQMQRIFALAIISLGLAEIIFWFCPHSIIGTAIGLWVFFTAFTLLEAMLPSLISKLAPAQSKGTAIGVYSTCQFLGIFFGGAMGGWLYGHYHATAIFSTCTISVILWFGINALGSRSKTVS